MKRKISAIKIIIMALSTVIVALFGVNTEIYATDHNYGEWYVTIEPTCNDYGEEERVCLDCMEKETRIIEALGHDFSNEWTIDIEPTCTTEGIRSNYCKRCDLKTNITNIRELGHDYSAWYIKIEATCTEGGVDERVCNNCQQTETRIIDQLGHDFNNEWTIEIDPKYKNKEYRYIRCRMCDETTVPIEIELENSGSNLTGWILCLPLAVIFIAVITLFAIRLHNKKKKALVNVTIEPRREEKVQKPAIFEENAPRYNKTEAAVRPKISKGNLVSIIICVIFIIICIGVILWSML